MRDFLIQQLLPVLAGPLQIVLMALAAWVAVRIRRHVHNQDLSNLLVTLDNYVAGAVADVYQRSVKAAKESGGWNAQSQQAAKDAALAQVRQLAPSVIKALQVAGENVDVTMSQMVERAVVELNAKVRPSVPTPSQPPKAA